MTRLTRAQKRVPYLAPVSVAAVGEGSMISGEALNLSTAGILVRSAAACSPGSEVFCDVPLPTGVSRLKGRVTRLQRLSEGTGMAIQFVELTEREEAMLQDLVEHRSAAASWTPGPLPSVIIADDLGSELEAPVDTTEVGPAPIPPPAPRPVTWSTGAVVMAISASFALVVALLGWFFSSGAMSPTPVASTVAGGAPAAAPAPAVVPPPPQVVPLPPVVAPARPQQIEPIKNPVLAAAVGQLNDPKRGGGARNTKRARPPSALTFDPDSKQYRLSDSVALDLGGARLTNVAGLAATPQANLRGINVAVHQDATEMRVDLPQPEPDNSYGIQVTPSWPTVIAISEKTASGFIIRFGTRAPDSARIDWFLTR